MRFEKAGLGATLFHDEFVKFGVEWNWVVAIEAGHTEFVGFATRGTNHTLDVKVAQRVSPEIFADFLHRALVCEEFFGIGKINAVVAGVFVRWATDPHVDFLGAVLAQVHHAGAGGRSANNRIIDHHHAFPLYRRANEVEFYPHVEIADHLSRLNKCAADVVVSNEGRIVRNPEFFRKSQRRKDAGVGHRNNKISLHRVTPCEFASHLHAGHADVCASQVAVWARKVNVFKNAKCTAFFFERPLAAKSIFINDQNFARFDITNKLGVNQIKRTALRSENVGSIELAEAQWTKSMRITKSDDLVFAHENH